MMKKISFPIKNVKNPSPGDDIAPVTKLVLSNMGIAIPGASEAGEFYCKLSVKGINFTIETSRLSYRKEVGHRLPIYNSCSIIGISFNNQLVYADYEMTVAWDIIPFWSGENNLICLL